MKSRIVDMRRFNYAHAISNFWQRRTRMIGYANDWTTYGDYLRILAFDAHRCRTTLDHVLPLFYVDIVEAELLEDDHTMHVIVEAGPRELTLLGRHEHLPCDFGELRRQKPVKNDLRLARVGRTVQVECWLLRMPVGDAVVEPCLHLRLDLVAVRVQLAAAESLTRCDQIVRLLAPKLVVTDLQVLVEVGPTRHERMVVFEAATRLDEIHLAHVKGQLIARDALDHRLLVLFGAINDGRTRTPASLDVATVATRRPADQAAHELNVDRMDGFELGEYVQM